MLNELTDISARTGLVAVFFETDASLSDDKSALEKSACSMSPILSLRRTRVSDCPKLGGKHVVLSSPNLGPVRVVLTRTQL